GERARRARHLTRAAQVDHRPDAVGDQRRPARRGQPAGRIGAHQRPEPHAPSVDRRQPTQVPRVLAGRPAQLARAKACRHARGAVNALLTLPPQAVARGLVTASGGNHGLGVAYAGWVAGAPATVYLPRNTPPGKAEKLASWGARVVMGGEVWDDANRLALEA